MWAGVFDLSVDSCRIILPADRDTRFASTIRFLAGALSRDFTATTVPAPSCSAHNIIISFVVWTVAKPLMQQPFKGLKREREKNLCGPEVDVKYKCFVTAFNAQKRWPRVHESINSGDLIIIGNCLCLLFLLRIIAYIVITILSDVKNSVWQQTLLLFTFNAFNRTLKRLFVVYNIILYVCTCLNTIQLNNNYFVIYSKAVLYNSNSV